MTYQVADNWDNEGALADLSVQPRCEGLRVGRRRIAGDGLIYDDGNLTGELIFDYMTKAQKTAIDSELGLSSVSSNKITITLPYGANRTVGNYNAIVDRPDETVSARFERTRWLQIRYILRGIHAT